jgi:formylglycine-generating enzyme required for sulfatase activity
VLNSGRILYARWEYSDAPHYFTRLLFSMNPDGTNQVEYYASNSMWPNSTFYARPIPNHPTQIVGVISGHHGVPRMGELILFDPAKGRREADGVVQRIPGHGRKVEPIIVDGLVEGSWPKFLHPYPLSDKYFLVSAKPTPQAEWGLYLVDVFDNLLLIREEPGYALFEPVPFRRTPKPPTISDKVDLTRNDATVHLTDVYRGPGLKDVPRGTVKKLRIYELQYAYPGMGGHINIGIDGPWDVHRIRGTVPVEADGSASFHVPANMPLSVQPLDSQGQALQVMRSWFTAMPGENVSCVGCHDTQNSTPPPRGTLASLRQPSDIAPWYGPARGFSFKRDVQPALDKFCVGCHNPERKVAPDLTAKQERGWRGFTPSYVALHPYVRRPGPESDYHLQQPLEFHASTSELIQMLRKGHYNVQLDNGAWDRLITWIDLNVPDHGTWQEHRGGHSPMEQRRQAMRTRYANRPEDPEAIPELEQKPIAPIIPPPVPQQQVPHLTAAGWPFDAAEAQKRQKALNLPTEVQIELSDRVTMALALIPPGEFIMGDAAGSADEYPPTVVKIDKPFYLGVCEVTNAQYAVFNPRHDSAYISQTNKDQNERGWPVNRPSQPVVRVTWHAAQAFCRWLSQETGHKINLPTEGQWEWACRAGTSTPFYYGGPDADFSKFANLADAALQRMARADSPKWHPRDDRFNDGAMVTADVGRYQPNAWGLRDLIGNVAEWTRSTYRPYPYQAGDSRNDPQVAGQKVVRGGSWYDRPQRARTTFRLPYEPWQHVYNVGFRVVMEAE